MTIEEARKELKSYLTEKRNLAILEAKINELNHKAAMAKGLFTGEFVDGGFPPKTMKDFIVEMEDLMAEWKKRFFDNERVLLKIQGKIKRVKEINSIYGEVLVLRYIQGYKVFEIASRLVYSYDRMRTIAALSDRTYAEVNTQ